MITSNPYFLPHNFPVYLQHSSLPTALFLLFVCFVFDNPLKQVSFVFVMYMGMGLLKLQAVTSSKMGDFFSILSNYPLPIDPHLEEGLRSHL